MTRFILLFTLICVAVFSYGQRELGTWQDYLSYNNGVKVALSSNMVFCATSGGLFYYDTEDNGIVKYTELSDFGINTMAYSQEDELLVVAYENSNIDVIKDGSVINLSDIKRKSISGNKSIYNISFRNGEAYLACGFGIVVLNLDKQEVKDTYYIGEDGDALTVYDVEFFNGQIYAATEDGILFAPENGVNLLDYANWSRDENIPNNSRDFTAIEEHNGSLLANYYAGENFNDEVYIFNGSSWNSFYSGAKVLAELESNGSYLTLTAGSEVVLFDNSLNQIGKINNYQFENETVSSIAAQSSIVASDGIIWIADDQSALVKVSGSSFESLYPLGPMDNSVFYLTSDNSSSVWVTPGGRTDAWGNSWMAPRFQRFQSGEWTNFSKSEYPEMDGFFDVVCLAVDPFDENHFFVGSWGGGVLEFKDDQFVQRYTNHNSPLETALPQQPDEPFVRIGGLDFDSEGNLWITNTATAQYNLHKLSPAGEWESFSMAAVIGKNIGQMVVNEYDDKWVLVPRGNNAYVVDKTGDNKRRLLVKAYFSNGSEEVITDLNDVYSIAEDLDGAIWMGTSKGVAVYNSPSRIWSEDFLYASQPSVDLGDGLYHPLLETQTVTAIAVDGANRKWLGTDGGGVFLVSESGEEEILNFTAENSALLSNNILSITINQKNGEVFFGTDKGLISYQGEATGGNSTYSNVYVYPNPVRETYHGPVTVTGLIENTDVKITDISGNLVFKTTSLGGQAVWDGTNLNGNRVKTGVYLVFCNDENGEETHITKILFIH